MKAFPHYWTDENNQLQMADGMDLRDYFAAKAMQAFCWHTSPVPMESIGIRAYEMADEMMKAREQP